MKLKYHIIKWIVVLNGIWFRIKKIYSRMKYCLNKEAMNEIKEQYENRETEVI